MSGGRPRPVMSAALHPPATAPIKSVHRPATLRDSPASRQSLPKTIAHSPSSDPTERSMPPVRMMGVMTSASRPISTEWRRMSHVLSKVPKRGPTELKQNHSRTTTRNRVASCRRKADFQSPGSAAARIQFSPAAQAVRDDGEQDDGSLDGLLPVRLDAQVRQGRRHARKQEQPGEHPPQVSASARD